MTIVTQAAWFYYVFGWLFLLGALAHAWVKGSNVPYLRLLISIPIMAVVWPMLIWEAMKRHD